jgi:hypothetical protein
MRLLARRMDLPAARTRPRSAPSHLRNLDRLDNHLNAAEGTVVRIAHDLTERCRSLTVEINQLEREIAALVEKLAPSLLVGLLPISPSLLSTGIAPAEDGAQEPRFLIASSGLRDRDGRVVGGSDGRVGV